MKLVVDLSLGIKVWDILFYLLGKSDAGASNLDFSGFMIFRVRDVSETHWGTFSYVHIEIRVIMLNFESFLPLCWSCVFWFLSACCMSCNYFFTIC